MKRKAQFWGCAELKRQRAALECDELGDQEHLENPGRGVTLFTTEELSTLKAEKPAKRSQSPSMEHLVQTVIMGRPGEALATPRRDGMLSTFRRLDAVNRNWQRGWEPDVKWSRQPMTPKHLKKPWKRGYNPNKWKSLHPQSRVNRANRTRIWHIYN